MELARRRDNHRLFHHRIERGSHARWPSDEVALAQTPSKRKQVGGQAEPGVRSRTGLLGKIRALLRRGAPPDSLASERLRNDARSVDGVLRRKHDRCCPYSWNHLYGGI